MAAKFKVKVDQPAWLKMIRDKQRPVATAAVAALRETAANAVQEGRSNIAGAGRFGPKWQQDCNIGRRARRKAASRRCRPRPSSFTSIGIAGVFEHGATIQGKPLLWIPTTEGGAARPAARARN